MPDRSDPSQEPTTQPLGGSGSGSGGANRSGGPAPQPSIVGPVFELDTSGADSTLNASETLLVPGEDALLHGAIDEDAADRLLARMIIDRSLATESEVKECLDRRGGVLRKSFEKVLVQRGVITQAQLERLQETIESRRSGRTIPGFVLLERIGKGTTATVYKARQLNLDRLVAIKVLPARALKNPKVVEQFYAEGRAAAQLNHPNIVQAIDVGRRGDFHYFVMEFVDGHTIFELLEESRALHADRALDVTIAMADALRHAHERGFVHRDVKPKNIIVTKEGVPKLADLGLARAIADRVAAQAEKGQSLGTPYYISPEQVRGEEHIGPASDIYSLGATLFHMVTGRPPFTGTDADEVMNRHLTDIAPPAHTIATSLHPGISEVIEKTLRKDPSERYFDCQTLLDELRAWRSVLLLERGERARDESRGPK